VRVTQQVLLNLLGDVHAQMEELAYRARVQGVETHQLRLQDGSWPMIPLLVAKSNILLALSKEQ
jgi:hypothetical protein